MIDIGLIENKFIKNCQNYKTPLDAFKAGAAYASKMERLQTLYEVNSLVITESLNNIDKDEFDVRSLVVREQIKTLINETKNVDD